MTKEDDRVAELLRSALPVLGSPEPARDLWPLVAARTASRVQWSWLDVVLAAAALAAFAASPPALLLLLYHL